jgi:hydrogenase expression/formation protein HypD
MFRLRDRGVSLRIMSELERMDLDITLMHVCGTHQDTLIRFGLDGEFRRVGIDIRQGPGCPVCVTPPEEVELALELARKGVTVTAFGDLMRVPGRTESLNAVKAEGGDVRVVFGALLADPPDNFSVLSFHRVVPPALRAIASLGEIRLDGMIQPGHVSTIIGTKPYEFLSKENGIPQVVAGFEPLDLMMGVYLLAKQAISGRAEVQNEYSRVVKPDGNPVALKAMAECFTPSDVRWRGFPVIPESGLAIRGSLENHDARRRYEDLLGPIIDQEYEEPKGCRCGEMLRGILTSEECPLFGRQCTPSAPVGPCMVSREGSCYISYRYRGGRKGLTNIEPKDIGAA